MLDDATTYYQPPAGCTWYFGIDDAYTRDKADIVSSANSQFIAADWTDSDFLNGKVCWRCDFTTQALKDSVADAGNKSMYAALWMTPSGGLPALMGHWDINMRNIAVDPTSVGAVAGVVFDTVDRADSTYQKQKPDQGTIWFKNGKDPLIYCTTTGFYYPIVAVDVGGGIIQFVPGTGEAIS